MPALRVVVDTSVLVAAFLRRGGVNASVLHQAGKKYRLYLAEATLEEIHRVLLTYRRIRQRYHYSDAEVEDFIENLITISEKVFQGQELTIPPVISRDPKDDFVLACALAAQAACIVSKDQDLIELKTYQGIKILATEDFLALLGSPP